MVRVLPQLLALVLPTITPFLSYGKDLELPTYNDAIRVASIVDDS